MPKEIFLIPDRKWHYSDFDHFEVRCSSKKVSRSFGKDCTIFGKEDFSRKNLGNIKETERQSVFAHRLLSASGPGASRW